MWANAAVAFKRSQSPLFFSVHYGQRGMNSVSIPVIIRPISQANCTSLPILPFTQYVGPTNTCKTSLNGPFSLKSYKSTSNFSLDISEMSEHGSCGAGSTAGIPPLTIAATTTTNTTKCLVGLQSKSDSVIKAGTMSGGDSGAAGSSSGAGGNAMDLSSLFECPVCMDFALPPILQCQSGHIVCRSCREKLSICPTCRGTLENIRNLAMEKLAASVFFPCKYSTHGCTESFRYTEKNEHENICEHRPYSCPCPGASCKWFGQLDKVMNHLIQSHKSITTLQGEDIVFLATDITLPGAVDWVMMQSCFGHYFMLVLEKQERELDQRFFALVLLIGTKKQAENFMYKLDLTATTRRLTWEATPYSIHDGVQAAISDSDCLVFDSHTALLFADSGSLGINVTISKVQRPW